MPKASVTSELIDVTPSSTIEYPIKCPPSNAMLPFDWTLPPGVLVTFTFPCAPNAHATVIADTATFFKIMLAYMQHVFMAATGARNNKALQ